MTDDYLWNGTGETDPEVAGLESTLAELRWSGKQIEPGRAQPVRHWYRKRSWAMAAAAMVVLGLGTAFVIERIHRMGLTGIGDASSWQLSFAGQKPSTIRAGQVIETGSGAATMESELVGEVTIDPDSRLRFLSSDTYHHRMALDHGTIHALIWAPPTNFVVDTAAAKTVDLGCKYTLFVGGDGDGFLTVEMGWVAFQWNRIESFIPEGAACTTRLGHGPDTPYFRDAPRVFTKALAEFDHDGDRQALNALLEVARPRDALTLWHLLERTQSGERARVFTRFAELVDLPSNATRKGVLSGDRPSMDAAWDALKLGDTSWWREWKRDW